VTTQASGTGPEGGGPVATADNINTCVSIDSPFKLKVTNRTSSSMVDVVTLLSVSWKILYAIEQITNRIEQIREDGRALKVSSVVQVLPVLHD
jgi:hypothetical protein